MRGSELTERGVLDPADLEALGDLIPLKKIYKLSSILFNYLLLRRIEARRVTLRPVIIIEVAFGSSVEKSI